MALHSTEWPRPALSFRFTLSTGLLIAYNAYSEPIEPELHCAKTPTYRYLRRNTIRRSHKDKIFFITTY